ncbi:MAG: discoidin domain-containing protein [Eubacteriales bacterium]|nr:discoidin domain-containing protein [Eubacteriales bacterium]
MKKTLPIIVALVMVLTCFASIAATADFTAPDYEPANLTTEVGIMLADDISFEGVTGIQTTGTFTSPWRDAVMFELDEETGAYKAIAVYASAGTGPDWTIGENQFVVESNCGNDWPTLFSTAVGTEWYYDGINFQDVPYSECPNFINAKNQAWDAVLKTISVGDLYTLVGIDLSAPEVIANYAVDANYDHITYNDTYETYSYLTPYVEPGEEVDYGIAVGKTYTKSGMLVDEATYTDIDNKELTDGIIPASPSYSDVNWVGFNANSDDYAANGYAEIVIDLGEVADISGINVVMSNLQNSGIAAPAEFKFFYSTNGTDYTEIGTGSYDVDPFEKDGETFVNGNKIVNNGIEVEASAQYVKVQFTNSTGCAWMFIGEVQVFGASSGEESSEEPSEEPSVEPSADESSEDDTPETGDSGFVALAIVSVISLAGAVVIKRRK